MLNPARATRIAAVLLFVLAGGIGISSVITMALRIHPGTSTIGMGFTVAALVIVPILARAKRRVGRGLEVLK